MSPSAPQDPRRGKHHREDPNDDDHMMDGDQHDLQRQHVNCLQDTREEAPARDQPGPANRAKKKDEMI
jgi:hypothetical protein